MKFFSLAIKSAVSLHQKAKAEAISGDSFNAA